MYTNHFFNRMNERVYNNKKKLNNKQQKIQNNHSKFLVKRALENKVAEYKDTYGYKYIYAYINDLCYKYIFDGKKVITIYEIDLDKETKKYDLKLNY